LISVDLGKYSLIFLFDNTYRHIKTCATHMTAKEKHRNYKTNHSSGFVCFVIHTLQSARMSNAL